MPESAHFRQRLRPIVRRTRALWRAAYLRAQARPGCRIVIGAEGHAPPGWIATEIEFLDLLKEVDWRRYFVLNSIGAILAEHVWEHLTQEEALIAARLCCRYLQPGGYLRVAVPDGYHPDPTYIAAVRPGGNGAGADDHKMLWNHNSLSVVFRQTGFMVNLLEWHTCNGRFRQAAWLPEYGPVRRCPAVDPRGYRSLILDAYKP